MNSGVIKKRSLDNEPIAEEEEEEENDEEGDEESCKDSDAETSPKTVTEISPTPAEPTTQNTPSRYDRATMALQFQVFLLQLVS